MNILVVMNLPNGYLLQNGKYRLTHVVGQGGFGITYRGIWYTEVKGSLGTVKTEVPICVKEYFFKDYCYRDTDSYAVKVHSETGKTLFDRFKEKLIKEAKILSDVHHPYIVNVLEVFEENGTAYIAMEYISGFSLKYMMEQEGLLPEKKVLKYVYQIGKALQFVHEKNILHLDIKPSNILIDKNDNARLIDFGVSKRYDIEQQETSTTMLTLSKGFASIEQYDDEGTQTFSPCPDIYSLGATMYNLLTGKLPTESILRAARPLSKPTDLNPDISPEIEAVIVKAMQIIPTERYQTVQEMLDLLDIPLDELSISDENTLMQEQSEPEGDEDTTVLYSQQQTALGEEDEQTIVNVPSVVPAQEKKKRKGTLAAVLVSVFVVLASVLGVFIHKSRLATANEAENTSLPLEEEQTSIPKVTEQSPALDAQTKDMEKSNVNIVQQPLNPVEVEPKAEKEKTMAQKLTPIEDEVDMQPKDLSESEVDSGYLSLVNSGKTKMMATDFTGAKSDFTKAKDMKLTEEVVRLIIGCDAKLEEKRIADRKVLYEEKMTFGKYKIVRKKATGMYGAIDTNGEERIPCKYLSVGKADNGRAFERSDNLFDIYNVNGTLMSEGLTYY